MSESKETMLRNVVEIQVGIDLTFKAWGENRIASAIAALHKVSELNKDIGEILAKEITLPDEKILTQWRKEAYEKFGYNYDALVEKNE